MTRIIPRCFLLLAFTGVLLSTAQETSSHASHSTPQSRETSSSAPESSSVTVGTSSSYSLVEKTEEESTFHPTSAAATGNPNPDVTKSEVVDKTTVSENVDDTTPVTIEDDRRENIEEEAKSAPVSTISQTERQHNAESGVTEISPEKLSDSTDKPTVDDSTNEDSNTKGQSALNTSNIFTEDETSSGDSGTASIPIEAAKHEGTTTTAASKSTEKSFPENATNDSEQNSVPSKEESVYNSSYVDKNQSPKELSSTTPSKVQTEENESNDIAKSATHKRSLNATNTMTSSTTAVSSGQIISIALPTAMLSNYSMPLSEAIDDSSGSIEVSSTMKLPVPADPSSNTKHGKMENITVKDAHDTTETEVTNFPHTINSVIPNNDASVAHFHEPEHVAELASSGYPQDAHMSPISSAALSTSSEESIHPFESRDTTAQTLNDRRGLSTASSDPQRPPELEIESVASTGHSYTSVTFDPDGMTHNYPQDPDSITFSPAIFHVDGMSTDGSLSRLEHKDSFDYKSELGQVSLTQGTTNIPGILASSSHEADSMEREREVLSSSSHGVLPHDEPDIEELHSMNVAPSTQHPAIVNIFSTGESLNIHTFGTSDSSKIVLPLNDESEEMLNDSPHFVQIQSKPTVTPTEEVKNKYVIKDFEINANNDINHVTGSSPQVTSKTVNELDFSTEHHPEQSEIRPVTAVSPLKIPESTTILPVPKESHSQPESAKTRQPETVLPDTSSPIILSNPAPIIANQSAETITEVLQPDIVVQSNVSDLERERQNDTTFNTTTSTIAGIAVKTSVSVSLPLSNSPNDAVNLTAETKEDTNLSPNASVAILPLPIPINKEAGGHPAPTVAPTLAPDPLTTESRGLRIRKPKLKFNSDDSEPATPRTRKPFLQPPQKSSSTVGPPVSIFKKARTRMASITSSTTARPFPQFSTIRYVSRLPGMVPGGELVFSTELITTTVPTTTETEEPFSYEPFTEQTQGPVVPNEDNLTIAKVAGYIVLTKGLRWSDQLNDRLTPQYKEKANFVQVQLNHLFRTSPIATQLWKIEIDGFSRVKESPRSVAVDFFLSLIKTPNEVTMDQLTAVFQDKLKNNTFSRFTVDTNKTSFEHLNYELMKPTTEAPEVEHEPVIPQWAIAVIVVGAASLIFIVLFAAVAVLGRHHMRRRYSSKLNDEDSDRPSEWESKMAAAYENLAADTIYDAEDMHSDTYKKRYPNATYHGRPSRPSRADSWSSSDWSPPPRRPRPQVHRIVH